VLHAVVFLVAMLAAYYVVTLLLLGYFLPHLLRAWIVVALVCAPPFAALVWYGRGRGWRSALAAAVPIGLLLYEALILRVALELYGVNQVQVVFDIVAAVVLLLILPRRGRQQALVLAFTPVIVLGAKVVNEYMLPHVIGFGL
jgi:hypothetical protein